jgi:hypothetical protein
MTAEPTQVLVDGRTVSRRLRLRSGQLHELVRAGRVRLFDGGRYDFDQVRQALTTEQDLDLESFEHEDSSAIALRIMREHADRAMSQQTRMFELSTNALESANAALRAENDALRERAKADHAQIVELQERQIKNLEAHELVLSKAHERELASKRQANVERRRDEGLEMLKKAVPPIAEGIKQTFAQRSMVKKLFDTISPAQLEAIMVIDFFTPEQKAILAGLVAQTKPPAPSSSTSSKPPESGTQAHSSAGDGAPHHGAENAA